MKNQNQLQVNVYFQSKYPGRAIFRPGPDFSGPGPTQWGGLTSTTDEPVTEVVF